MKIELECFPCLFRQLNRTLKLITDDKSKVKEIIDELGVKLKDINFNMTPPEAGAILYSLINEKSNITDPYKRIKKESIKLGIKLYPNLKKQVVESEDRLLESVKIAIAGNIIDFGAQEEFDIQKELSKTRDEKINLRDYKFFKDKVNNSKQILIIGDNAGETVFDKILLEELKDKKIIYAVRGFPTINDAIKEDAIESGIGEFAKIITTGSNIPGVVIKKCSDEFNDYFYNSDLVISKGQGNYETLSDIDRDLFFLFKIKCSVVSRKLELPIGESILYYKN
jgi:uncharacterized protein with ATP-grasp and redox domains